MRKLTLSLAIMAVLLPGRGFPLGLGEIELNSALNQELDAEVQVLSAAIEDAEQLIIKLASREAFSRAGIDRPFLLTQLKFKIVVKNDIPYIKIYSKKPIREPFLSFLLDVDWPDGHLLREYTLLLDPPVYSGMSSPSRREDSGRPFIDPADQTQSRSQSGSQQDYQGMDMGGRPAAYDVDAPRPSDRFSDTDSRPAASDYRPSTGDSRPAASDSRRPMMVPTPAPAPAVIESSDRQRRVTYQPMPQYTEARGDYRVKQKDTLWSIANRYRPKDLSVEQMMLALVRENPEAFINENINGVKRGYILRMPNRQEMARIDRQQALAQVKKHTALWREYRQALTGARPASALKAKQTATADSLKADATDGKLSIVSASDGMGGETASTGQDVNAEIRRLRNQLTMTREALESERVEKEGLRTQLADLEQRVERVLELDDSELAKLQQELQGAQESVTSPTPVMDTTEPAMDEPVAEEPMVEDIVEQADALTQEEMAATPEEMAIEEEPIFIDEAPEAAQVQPEPVPVPAPSIPVAPAPAQDAPAFVQSRSKTFIQSLLDDPKMLASAGGLISAIALLIAMIMRRRRVNKDETEWVDLDEDATSIDEFDAEAEFGAASADAGDFNPSETAEMHSAGFDKPEADAALDQSLEADLGEAAMGFADEQAEGDKDDVISEADVYLSYGIYQQAEDLLKDAIAKNPDRDDYRLKLLETHYAAKNSDEFVALASEVESRKSSDKSYWDRVVAMGKELNPSHALFSGAAANVVAEDLLPKKPESTDLDFGAGDDLDLGMDDLLGEGADDDKTMVMDQPMELDAETPSFDDDLNLDAGLEGFAEEETATEEPAAADDMDMEFDLGDFDAELDMGEPELETSTESASGDIGDDFSLDFDASDLGFDKGESGEAGVVEDEGPAMDLDADLDLAMDLDTESSDSADADLELDDFSMDMDESTAASQDTGVELDSAPIDMDDGDFDISELSEDIDEVSTKLELAKAYIDMGDKAGAKSILEEVKQEGNNDQQSKADALLAEAS